MPEVGHLFIGIKYRLNLIFGIIPMVMNEFKVTIEQFEGPLDLMLHLIKEKELDLFDLDVNVLTPLMRWRPTISPMSVSSRRPGLRA